MGYSSQTQVEFFSQAKNKFTYDSSSTTVSAQNVEDQFDIDTTDISLVVMEQLIDNAVNYINGIAGTSIANMVGVAGAKTCTCTKTEAVTVKTRAALNARVYLKTGSASSSLSGMSYNTVTNDSTYTLLFDQDLKATANLKTAMAFKDVSFNYINAVTKYIAVADGMIDAYCGVPSGFFTAAGYGVTDEYHDSVELQRSTLSVPYSTNYISSNTQNRSYILKTRLHPVLNVASFSEETSIGAWTTRTENTDFIVVKDGVRFLQNVPVAGYRNIKISYTSGYTAVPAAVANVSARLAAQIMDSVVTGTNKINNSILSEVKTK
jgi:hypothetical protein